MWRYFPAKNAARMNSALGLGATIVRRQPPHFEGLRPMPYWVFGIGCGLAVASPLTIRKEHVMAIPWLLALKAIPWRDVMEHAPSVLKAARKLMDRQGAEPAPSSTTDLDVAGEALPSLGELKNRLIATQVQLDRQAQTQAEMAETLAELAEQNARLVSAVETLRQRTRLLLWVLAVLVFLVVWVVWR
jgi:hypothetical protein